MTRGIAHGGGARALSTADGRSGLKNIKFHERIWTSLFCLYSIFSDVWFSTRVDFHFKNDKKPRKLSVRLVIPNP